MYKLQNEKQTKDTTNDGILKYHKKLIEAEEISIPLTHIHFLTHFLWVRTPACRIYIALIDIKT